MCNRYRNFSDIFYEKHQIPCCQQEVLKRLPSSNRDGADSNTDADFNDSIMDVLQKHCAPPKSTSRPRGKKITPGKRITPEDLVTSTSHTVSSAAAKISVAVKSRCKGMEVDNKDSDTDVENSSSSDSNDETGSAIPEGQEPEP